MGKMPWTGVMSIREFSNLLEAALAGLRESEGFWFNSWLVPGELLDGAVVKQFCLLFLLCFSHLIQYKHLTTMDTFSFRQLVNQSCLFNVHSFEGPTTSAKFAVRINVLAILS